MLKIKIGDYIGRPNFPHNIAEVIDIQKNIYVIKLPPRQGSDGQDIIHAVTKQQLEKGLFVKLDIIDGEIIKEDETIAIEKPIKPL